MSNSSPSSQAAGSQQKDFSRFNLSPARIQSLVDEKQLLRVLHPALIEQLQARLSESGGRDSAIICHQEQIYLSLQKVDPRQREMVYTLIQQMQLGESVDLTCLPPSLRQLVQPEKTQIGRFVWILTMSILLGIVGGILAMAIGVLVLASIDASTISFAGVQATAVVFIVGSAVGCLLSALVLYFKFSAFADSRK